MEEKKRERKRETANGLFRGKPTEPLMLHFAQDGLWVSVFISEPSLNAIPGYLNSQGICRHISYLVNNSTEAGGHWRFPQ